MASTSSSGSQPQTPESAPDHPRRVSFHPAQLVGCFLLLAIPILSVSGILGDRRSLYSARAGEVELQADVPACARFGTTTRVTLKLSGLPERFNEGDVTVVIDRSYLARFSSVQASASLGTTSNTEVSFLPRPPRSESETLVELQMTPEEYGWAKGQVQVWQRGKPTVSLALKTFILP